MLEKITPKTIYDKQKCYHLNAVIQGWNSNAPVIRRILGDHAIPTDSEMQTILTDTYTEKNLDLTKADLFIDKVNRAMILQSSRTLLTLLISTNGTPDVGELRDIRSARFPYKHMCGMLSDTLSDLKAIKQRYKRTRRTLSEVILAPECQDAWVSVSTTMGALLGKMPPNFNRSHLAHLMSPILSRVEKLLDAAQTARFLHSDTEALNESVRAADCLLVSTANSLTPLVMEATEIMRIVVEADSIMSDREMRLER